MSPEAIDSYGGFENAVQRAEAGDDDAAYALTRATAGRDRLYWLMKVAESGRMEGFIELFEFYKYQDLDPVEAYKWLLIATTFKRLEPESAVDYGYKSIFQGYGLDALIKALCKNYSKSGSAMRLEDAEARAQLFIYNQGPEQGFINGTDELLRKNFHETVSDCRDQWELFWERWNKTILAKVFWGEGHGR